MNEEKKITHSFYLGTHLYVICAYFGRKRKSWSNDSHLKAISERDTAAINR